MPPRPVPGLATHAPFGGSRQDFGPEEPFAAPAPSDRRFPALSVLSDRKERILGVLVDAKLGDSRDVEVSVEAAIEALRVFVQDHHDHMKERAERAEAVLRDAADVLRAERAEAILRAAADVRRTITDAVRRWRPSKKRIGGGVILRGKGAHSFTTDSAVFRTILETLAEDIGQPGFGEKKR